MQSLQSTAVGLIAAQIYALNPAFLSPPWQNEAMAPSEPQDQSGEKEVLTNLPRSRRQRPSVRREAARIAQARANTPAEGNAAAKPTPTLEPVASVPPAALKRSSAVPHAGYTTPNHGKHFGNADPAGLLADLTRAALRLLPGW